MSVINPGLVFGVWCGRGRSFAPAASKEYVGNATEDDETNDSGDDGDGDFGASAEGWFACVNGVAWAAARFFGCICAGFQ